MHFPAANGPPVVVLGVYRSGTTLLKEMLDHHSELAIPPESYFLMPLWDRFRATGDLESCSSISRSWSNCESGE